MSAEHPDPVVGASTTPSEPGRVSARRLEVLRLLREAEVPTGIADLAERLGVHPNTVRFHLDALLDAGLVRRLDARRGSPGRPALRFAAVPGMDPGGPRRYGQLATALARALEDVPDASARALEAGRAWGREAAVSTANVGADVRAGVDRLLGLLGRLDFDPVLVRPSGGAAADHASRIGLRRCPFLEVASVRSAVVCPVHLGLMQGALEAWGAPVTVDRLEPFAEPDLCLAHLAPADAV